MPQEMAVCSIILCIYLGSGQPFLRFFLSVWRLAEIADALGLDLSVRARLPASSTARHVRG
jgi:hypothetical protein